MSYIQVLRSSHLERETAWAMDFNAMAINEEEEELLPQGASEAQYVQASETEDLIVAQEPAAILITYQLAHRQGPPRLYLLLLA